MYLRGGRTLSLISLSLRTKGPPIKRNDSGGPQRTMAIAQAGRSSIELVRANQEMPVPLEDKRPAPLRVDPAEMIEECSALLPGFHDLGLIPAIATDDASGEVMTIGRTHVGTPVTN